MAVEGKVSVIMPAFNEAAYIEHNVRETVHTLSSFEYDYEVIVVDDGSADETHIAAARVLNAHPERVRVVRYDRNEGKGNALMCGCRYASGDYIVFLDADMDLHPSQLPLLFQILKVKNASAVVGSKWHPASSVKYPKRRKIYSLGYFALVWLLFGLPLRDTQTGLKVFRADALKATLPSLLAKRFAFDIELLANMHRRGYKLASAPVTLSFTRTLGRIKLKDVWRMLLDTLAIFYRMRLLRYYDRVSLDSASTQESRLVDSIPGEHNVEASRIR